jgi:hypothetical protein
MKNILKAREKYLEILENEIIKEVVKILKKHTNLVSYTCCMGSSSFTDKNGNHVDLIQMYTGQHTNWELRYKPTYKYFNRLLDLYSIESNFCLGLLHIKKDYFENKSK